jgi:hypothetical protein
MENFSKLTILHNIQLSKEERYYLQNEESIVQIIGVCVPVWCNGEETNEPAREIFCRYVLKNSKIDKAIRILEDGFIITLPNQIEVKKTDGLIFANKSNNQRSYKNLLDPIDRGGRTLQYREKNRAIYKNKKITIMHYVHIGDEEESNK